MKRVKNQVLDLGGQDVIENAVPGVTGLKALDEWNYTHFTIPRDDAVRQRQPRPTQ